MKKSVFKTVEHEVDLCVVGAGMAGFCAAIAAARHGAKVALVHDRPVYGGNASSEIRMHICGADRHNGIKNMRETGILEELRLENLKQNPNKNYSVWDAVLFNFIKSEPNIIPILNCTVNEAEVKRGSIQSITGWQLTSETFHKVKAKVFADCTGDGTLAPLVGAQFRIGREGRAEFNESIAPEIADAKTMGLTCMFEAEEFPTAQPYTPPSWARKFLSCDELPYGVDGHSTIKMGYWWIELGGEYDSIHDAEFLRDELLKVVYGVWDHIKNHCKNKEKAKNWTLTWIQFLPAKRESRRYVGTHVLNQNEVREGGKFDDVVAYGGWSMDDHHPAGFESTRLGASSTIFHEGPSPYGIPFGSLQSKNIANLMFAGRDASCTHAAMSSSRVMGTCAAMGQALGTSVALALAGSKLPKQLNKADKKILQQALLLDDCYLPYFPLKYGDLTKSAKLETSNGLSGEALRDGINRPVGDDLHAWLAKPGDSVSYLFGSAKSVKQASLVLDSALDKDIALSRHYNNDQMTHLPHELPKRFAVDVLKGGAWKRIAEIDGNSKRLVRIPVNEDCEGVRYTLLETYGAPESKTFLFYLD